MTDDESEAAEAEMAPDRGLDADEPPTNGLEQGAKVEDPDGHLDDNPDDDPDDDLLWPL